MIELLLPYPPTMNHYWRRGRHGTFISADGRNFRRSVGIIAAADRVPMLTGPLAVFIRMTPPDRRRRDIDNILKPLLDALQHAGCYEDDNQIEQLTIRRRPPINGGNVLVTITEAQP